MSVYEKSLKIVQDSMKDVKHEFCITLEDKTTHIVYVHDIILGESVTVDWSTLSEDRKDELGVHVEKCVEYLIKSTTEKYKRKKLLSF